jgi:uncharacterized protein YidB (DUF937 family)
MSLLSDLTRTALGALTSSPGAGSQSVLANIVTDLINQHPSGNGLTGLLDQLGHAGLGAQAGSWVGTGANQPVTGDQIHQALGPDKIAALAQRAGLPPGQLADALAHVLPQVIDQLTPQGQVPQGGGLQAALGGLLQSDWFRGLTAAPAPH